MRKLLLLFLLGLSAAAHSEPENVSAGELALLPDYCRAKGWGERYGYVNGPTASQSAYWLSRLGPSWKGLHHYCWGLVNVRRALAAGVPPRVRSHLLATALNDYEYTLQNSTPDFVLLPEIYLRVAEAHALLNNQVAANAAYRRARSIKPDYWPAYLQDAQLLVKLGLNTEAKRLLAEGLSRVPGNRQMQDLYRKLGGDPKAIVPMAAASAPDAAASMPPGEVRQPPSVPSDAAPAASNPSQ